MMTDFKEKFERFLRRPADGKPTGIREANAIRLFVEWCDEDDRLFETKQQQEQKQAIQNAALILLAKEWTK
jgi:hypothetical protein